MEITVTEQILSRNSFISVNVILSILRSFVMTSMLANVS